MPSHLYISEFVIIHSERSMNIRDLKLIRNAIFAMWVILSLLVSLIIYPLLALTALGLVPIDRFIGDRIHEKEIKKLQDEDESIASYAFYGK